MKGPCHIWTKETAAEKKETERVIQQLNDDIESILQEQWEFNTAINRLDLRQLPERKPRWRFTEANGKLVRKGNGGIDWYRSDNPFISLTKKVTNTITDIGS
jgi:hypothetical protein